MLKIKEYVKAESLEQAYELNQKKTNCVIGGMLWLKMVTRNVQKAIDAEVERQIQLVENGEKVEQATRRYDETQKTTNLMRKKEGNVDYKFIP